MKNIKENTTQSGGIDDGPRFMYGNRETYMKYARRMAEKLGMSIEDWVMDMEKEFDISPGRDVVDAVSYFPTGDSDAKNHGTDYFRDVSSKRAYELWAARAEKIAKIANLDVNVVDDLGADESRKEPIAEGLLTNNTGDTDFSDVEIREEDNPDIDNDNLINVDDLVEKRGKSNWGNYRVDDSDITYYNYETKKDITSWVKLKLTPDELIAYYGKLRIAYRTSMGTGHITCHFSFKNGNLPTGDKYEENEIIQHASAKIIIHPVEGDLEEIARICGDVLYTIFENYPVKRFSLEPLRYYRSDVDSSQDYDGNTFQELEDAFYKFNKTLLGIKRYGDGKYIINDNSLQRMAEGEVGGRGNIIEHGCYQYIRDNVDHLGIYNLLALWEDQLIHEHSNITDDQVDLLMESNLITILGEKSYKDLRRDAPHYLRTRDRSKQTPGSRFQSIDEKNVVHFKTPSHETPGLVYDEWVRLLDLDELLKTQSGIKKPLEIIRMALEGNIEIHCTCPAWKYWGYQYMGTKDDYSIEDEPRYPRIRNPRLKGSVCKHLDNVLFILPFQNTKILKELRAQKRL
jgi:hypothetical protein